MFDRLFNRKKAENKPSKVGDTPKDTRKLTFEMLIHTYLENYGIDLDGNKSLNVKAINEEGEKLIRQALEVTGFIENIEEIIISDWEKMKLKNISLKRKEFVSIFIAEFHNLKIEAVAPEFVKERNKKLLSAYQSIINTIERMQGWFDDEGLRIRIESDFLKKRGIQATMLQCTTPFCKVSLGCDQMGRYNLVYSVDYRFQEMISEEFASRLIRRIYEFTPGEMEPFVKIGSLYTDCVETFNILLEESKVEPFHKITKQEKHKNN
jgi:hypothetical protein